MKTHQKVGLFFIIIALLVAQGCGAGAAYFGKIEPPGAQRLIYLNAAEPETLDPGKATGVPEGHIIQAMFDGLTAHHPTTLEPMAALATHYETNADSTQFTFYLRGHASPRGMKLPNTDTLREQYHAGKLEEDFSRGIPAPPDNLPARWSDGRVITAHDFVYSWRRVVDPNTAADYASLLYYVKNAEEINGGKVRLLDPATGKEIITSEKEIQNDARLRAIAATSEVVRFTPADLGVRALDDYTFAHQPAVGLPLSYPLPLCNGCLNTHRAGRTRYRPRGRKGDTGAADRKRTGLI